MSTPATNDIAALRVHLFETLTALKDKQSPMDIDRAKAISEVAQTIINSAKVEVDHLRIVGGQGTGFIADARPSLPPPTGAGADVLPSGVTRRGNVTTHRLAG